MLPYLGDLAKVGKLKKYVDMLLSMINVLKRNLKLCEIFKPILAKLQAILRKIPLDSLPASLREPIEEMIGYVDEGLEIIKDNLCFTEDHEILARAPWTSPAGEYVPIGCVEPGMEVLTADPTTGTQHWRTVERRHVRTAYLLMFVTVIGADGIEQTLETTPEHPFRVAADTDGSSEPQWIAAEDLDLDATLVTADGSLATVRNIWRVYRTTGETVYNFEIAGEHDDFVRATPTRGPPAVAVLVHNGKYETPDGPPPGRGITPDDDYPEGFSYEIDNPAQRIVKRGDSRLEYRIEDDTLHIDWIEDADLAGRLKEVQRSTDGGFTKISGYATTKLEPLTDDVLQRLANRIGSELEGTWRAIIRHDGVRRYVDFVRE